MSTLKRGPEEGLEGEGVKKMKADGEAKDDLAEIRVLVDNYEASVIIGKGGANVKQVRMDSGAFVSILKDSNPSKERVMTVKGCEENIGKAMHLMMSLLLDASNQRKAGDPTGALGAAEDDYCMKLLIHKFLAGSVIGKGGTIIREIQESTQARISLSNEPLGNSTEKTVGITGNVQSFYAALQRVLNQLLTNPLRPGCPSVLYVPGMPVGGPMGMPMGGPMGGPMGMHPPYPGQHMGAPPPGAHYGAPAPYGAPPGRGMPATPYGGGPYGAPGGPPGGAPGSQKTEKIVIPTVCAGTVIGKGGSIISDIKMQSGTQITIADATSNAPEDRVVAITGAAQGIQTAIYLIKQRVESYQPPGARPM